jgi:tRNA(Ile)-lysidine synthase
MPHALPLADPAALDRTMDAFAASAPALPLAVAFSGGTDSTALLLACAERWPGQVQAWHVHHGLQAAADGFERHCAALCARSGTAARAAGGRARRAGPKPRGRGARPALRGF